MFTGLLTIAQISPLSFTVTDASSYTSEGQGTFSARRIYLRKADGTYLVPEGSSTDYIDFPFGEGSIKTISLLTEDYCLEVEGQWISNAPQPGSTYVYTSTELFTWNNELGYLGATRLQVSNPKLINDKNYFNNKSKWRTFIDDARQAVELGNDQYSAQGSLDQATYIKNNRNTLL